MGGAILIDFGTQDWYTRRRRACKKCLILLGFCERRDNPFFSAWAKKRSKIRTDFPAGSLRAIGTRGHQRISAKLVAWPLLAGTNEASDLLIDLQISWRSLWFRMDCSRS